MRVSQKTAQLQSNRKVQPEPSQPVDSSARVKSHLHTVHTVQLAIGQQHSKQPVYSSVRLYGHPIDSLDRVKSPCIQISQSL